MRPLLSVNSLLCELTDTSPAAARVLVTLIGSTLWAPFVRPWLEARVDAAGRPSSRRLQAAAARNGGQGRRCLAPGPEPCGPARTRRLAGSTGSMAKTHPLTAVSTVAPTPALVRCCLLLGPAARSHGAVLLLRLMRPRALIHAREGFSIGFKCSEAFLQPISMCYPVDNRLLGGVSRLLGGIFCIYPDFWGASRLAYFMSGRVVSSL